MMMIQYLEKIEKTTEKLLKETRSLREYYDNDELERFERAAKRGARISSNLYLLYRWLLYSICQVSPTYNDAKTLIDDECEMMDVSVEQLGEFDYPVYKISLPILLPNIRRQHADFNNAVTASVKEAIISFCREHNVEPFKRATMTILTYGGNPRMMVDNDNKEASVVQNGLIPFFLYDDSPASCNNIYYFKRVDSKEEYRTEIYLVDTEHDIDVMKMIKNI